MGEGISNVKASSQSSFIVKKKEAIMRRKEVLFAVAGGFVGASLAMAMGSLSPLGAQRGDSAVFGTVTCNALNVVDNDGDTKVELSSDGLGVMVSNKESLVMISGEQVFLWNVSQMTGAKMYASERGGAVAVIGKGGKDENNIWAAMHVDEYGNGAVSTWDKNGYGLK